MKRTCRRLQRILAGDGPAALRDDTAAQEHLAECAECFAVLEAVAELDAALAELPVHDAPDELVETLLARPELLGEPWDAAARAPTASRLTALGSLVRRPLPGIGWLWATAAGTLAATIGVLAIWDLSLRQGEPLASTPRRLASVRVESVKDQKQPTHEGQREQLRALGYIGGAPADVPASSPAEAPPAPRLDRDLGETITVTSEAPPLEKTASIASTFTRAEPEAAPPARDPWVMLRTVPGTQADRINVGGNESARKEGAKADEPGSSVGDGAAADTSEGGAYYNYDAFEDSPASGGESDVPARQRARDFLRQRAALEGLRFQPAAGYWSNTYVPGDSVFRFLQARLADSELHLHDRARQIPQPFDPPSNAALAVYLHADRRQIRGETRLLVQVGLQATERHGGRRPPMNVAVVLDAGGDVPAGTAAALGALVSAFGQEREPGDRFRLVVAGRPGGLAVGPEDFRNGPLTLAVERLFGGEAPTGATLDLPDALRTAISETCQDDDPGAPLGASAVVLLTSRPLDAGAGTLDTLRQLAHRSAVAGIPVSVVGVGDGVRLEELDAFALDGQGNRRLLRAAAEAPDLVARELSAVSRVVARAVRLSIRLAPGVRLVDVLGSHRLDEARAEEVREAERSIDQRLARYLGIEADRGDDEDGIQIVLPSFYAGDAHVVLLDVVAPGPGAIADVRVRYKDLVYLGNGQAQARLSLGRGEASESSWAGGPLERNVLKNLLAQQLREVLEQAGTSVEAGDSAAALRQLDDFRQLLEGLALEVRGLEHDADLARDAAMLGEYVELLGAPEESDQLLYLGDSMRYAALLKVLPRPTALEDPAGLESPRP